MISLKAEIDNLNRMNSKLENEHAQNEELKKEMQNNLFAAQTAQRKLQEEMDVIKADHQAELVKQEKNHKLCVNNLEREIDKLKYELGALTETHANCLTLDSQDTEHRIRELEAEIVDLENEKRNYVSVSNEKISKGNAVIKELKHKLEQVKSELHAHKLKENER